MSGTPVLQIIHISDLHLIRGPSLRDHLQYLNNLYNLSTLPPALIPGTLLQRQDHTISAALQTELNTIAHPLHSVVVVSGDISTWPGDSEQVINNHQFQLISSLPHPLLPILGNHDWGPIRRRTSYGNSSFETTYNITSLRYYIQMVDSVTVIFFLIDTNIRMFPAWGEISDTTLNWLRDQFAAGNAGGWGGLTEDQYHQAIKILVLHHTPLKKSEYQGHLNHTEYCLMTLDGRDRLLNECHKDIDIFLFGHTHVPRALASDGFVMVNAGSATGLQKKNASPNNLQCLRIHDDLTLEVESFFWNGTRFYPSHSVRFQQRAASGNVGGYRAWGQV